MIPSDSSNEREVITEYSISKKLKVFSEWLISGMVSHNRDLLFPAATREYAPYVEELWNDAAIQATYSRKDELELPRVASYFLDRVSHLLENSDPWFCMYSFCFGWVCNGNEFEAQKQHSFAPIRLVAPIWLGFGGSELRYTQYYSC